MRFIPLGPSSYIPATIKVAPKLVAMKLSHHQSWRLVKSCPLGKEPRNRLEKTQDQNKSSQGETKGSGSSQEKCSLVHNLLPVNSTIATQKWVFGDILEKKITNCLYFKVSLILALQTCLTFFFVFCWNLNVLRNDFFWWIAIIDFCVKAALHTWYKSQLIIVYNSFYILLDSVC